MASASADRSRSAGAQGVPASAMAVMAQAGTRLLIDSAALQQAVYLYAPVFDDAGAIVDLEIVMVNEAARHVRLAQEIVEGVLVSAVFVDLGMALEAANLAWVGGRPSPYLVERRGFHDGVPTTVRYEVATMRADQYLVQVSVDHTVVEQLATADARFRLMAESSIDGLMLLEPTPNGTEYVLSYANPRALLGEPSLRVGERLPPSIHDAVLEMVADLRVTTPVRRHLQREVLARRVSLEATVTEVGDGQVMLAVRELSSKEIARAELERSDRVLRAIGAGTFGTIAVYEPEFAGRELVALTLLWSAAGHGHGAGLRPPLEPTAVLAPRDLLQTAQSMLATGEVTRSGWVQVAADGEERSVEFTLVLAGDRFVLEFVERTEELAARTALTMVTATADAQRAFLSRVSHEMRSPLNIIHGYSQLLAQQDLPAPATEHVAHIEDGVDRMVQIVDDLLLLGQLDQGLVRMDEQPVTAAELAAEVLVTARRQAWWRDGVLTVGHQPGAAPSTVSTDRSRVVTVALLLAEASLAAAPGPLEVRPFGRDERAGVQFVADAESAVVGALWEPFVHSHTIPAAGLGLAVARGTAAALDLMVDVQRDADDPRHVRLVLSLPARRR